MFTPQHSARPGRYGSADDKLPYGCSTSLLCGSTGVILVSIWVSSHIQASNCKMLCFILFLTGGPLNLGSQTSPSFVVFPYFEITCSLDSGVSDEYASIAVL